MVLSALAEIRNRIERLSASDNSVTLSRLGRNRRLVLRFEWLTRLPIWRIFPVSSQRHDMAIVPQRPRRGKRRLTTMWDMRGPIIMGLDSVKHMSDMAFAAAPNHTNDAFQNETGLGGSSQGHTSQGRIRPAKVPHRFETAPVTRQAGGI